MLVEFWRDFEVAGFSGVSGGECFWTEAVTEKGSVMIGIVTECLQQREVLLYRPKPLYICSTCLPVLLTMLS